MNKAKKKNNMSKSIDVEKAFFQKNIPENDNDFYP